TVIGLGRFGTSIARTLNELGYEVTAIDMHEKTIQSAADYVTLAAQGDGTDQELLEQLNIDQSDVAIVAQSENLEASILTTLLLKKLKVPWVISKAKTVLHGELLRKVGADRVVFPEMDAGIRLAHSLGVRHISDYITLSPSAGIAKVEAPANLVGHTIEELTQGQQAKLNVLLIKRGNQLITVPHYQETIMAHDELLIVGADTDIEAFVERNPATPPFRLSR
ncbi:MAG TPA: TrkA family potassium uptake protein, partial [Thermomicrobiales bacterium]|nr:TrkA family potassium uptake protein [Thermomicrobiales bacterium]